MRLIYNAEQIYNMEKLVLVSQVECWLFNCHVVV